MQGMERAQHTHPFIGDDDFDLEDDAATRVQSSPFRPGATVIGYPVVVEVEGQVVHRFDPPLNGYPPGAAYIPAPAEDEGVIMRFQPYEYDVVIGPDGGSEEDETGIYDPRVHALYAPTEETLEQAAARYAQAAHGAEPFAAEELTSRPAEEVWPSARRTPTTGGLVAAATPSFGTPQPTFAETPHARSAMPQADTRAPLGSPPAYAAAYAQAQPAQFATAKVASTAAPSRDVTTGAHESPIRSGRAILGAMLGMLAGAALWGGVGFATGGWEFKYGAIVIGFLTGALAARFGGGRSRTIGLVGAASGVVGLVLGKALFELLVQPGLTMAAHIAYHTTPIDFVFFAATAATGFVVGAGSPGRALARLRRRVPVSLPSLPSVG
jgi:hypothetical protein